MSEWRQSGRRVVRTLCLVLFAAGLIVLFTVDADGDPMTSNLQPAVMTADIEVSDKRDAAYAEPEPDHRTRRGKITVVKHRLGEWLGSASERLWHPRAQPIRGP
jgi:hypothetical protein